VHGSEGIGNRNREGRTPGKVAIQTLPEMVIAKVPLSGI